MSDNTELKAAEQSAISGGEQSFYRGTGKSADGKGGKGRGNFLLKRKKGFIGLIISLALMTGGGAFLGSTNSLLAPAFNEVVTEVTDLQHASDSARTTRLVKYIMKNEDIVTTSWTGSKKYAHMSNMFKKNLARNNIEVEGEGFGKNRILKYDGRTITADDFIDIYRSDVEFRDSYNRARRGRIMSFFDDIANKLYAKLGISRNAFRDYKQTADSDADTKKFRETMTEESDTKSKLDTNTSGTREETETYIDENGEEQTRKKPVLNPNSADSGSASGDSAKAKAKQYIDDIGNQKAQQVSNIVSTVTGWGCTFMKVANAISIAVAANEIYQSINYFMGLAENPSKMKYGLGSESGINSMLNFVTTPAYDVEYDDYNKTTLHGDPVNSEDGSGVSIDVGTSKVSGSPIEANGMQKIMTGLPVDTKAANSFSLERTIKVLGGAATTTAAAFHTCAIAQTGAAIVSIAVTIGTFGLSSIASYAMGAVIGLGINAVLGTALSFLIPAVASALFTNIFENATGIPAGELLARGAFAANTRVGRTGSAQTPSSEAAIAAYNNLTNDVLALDAEVDRYNRSPFDITSKNTFLGSIAYKFGTTSSSSLLGKVKNLMRTTSSSIASVTGTVFADGEKSYIMTFGECPMLESLQVKGDMYCNPITTTDMSTIDVTPDDTNYINAIKDQMTCDDEGNCKLDKNKDLAKFITYCDGRDSPYGAVDSGILGDLDLLQKGGAVTTILGSLPIIGELTDLFDAAQNEIHMGWASGKYCVNSPANDRWGTYKYYQRYIQDQRLLEQLGVYEGAENPVVSYINEYEAEHPLDNTPSGYLARISGLSKEDAGLILDVAWYYNFLENYDPNTRIALDGTIPGVADGDVVIAKLNHEFRYRNFADQFKSETNKYETRAIVAERIVYADIRNRSYAV